MGAPNPQSLLAELSALERLRDPSITGQRQFQRFVVRGDAELLPMDHSAVDEQPIHVLMRDLGRGGIGFISQKPLEAGSTWHCHFYQRGYVIGRQALIVRHCRQIQDGVFLIGAQFCVETGIMMMLGVNPAAIREGDRPVSVNDTDTAAYLAPGEVA